MNEASNFKFVLKREDFPDGCTIVQIFLHHYYSECISNQDSHLSFVYGIPHPLLPLHVPPALLLLQLCGTSPSLPLPSPPL
jgi:hypothetical protein